MRGSASRSTGSPSDDAVIIQGAGAEKIAHRPVPITPALAAALKNAKGDRPGDAPLLLQAGRHRHGRRPATGDHRDLFRRAVERPRLDPDGSPVTRCDISSIVRSLLGGVPVAVVAQQHDTSVREIEAHYAAIFLITVRRALAGALLLDTSGQLAQKPDNVMTLPRPVRE